MDNSLRGLLYDQARSSIDLSTRPYRIPYIKGPKKYKIPSIFYDFFDLFSKYLAPSGAKYREKGWAVTKTGEG